MNNKPTKQELKAHQESILQEIVLTTGCKNASGYLEFADFAPDERPMNWRR